jgi:hypothetical protein
LTPAYVSQAENLERINGHYWVGATGICKSPDFLTLARDGKVTDNLWHAILLDNHNADHAIRLMPTYMYEHIHKRNWPALSDIRADGDCVFAVPKAHGRMALKISWQTRSILYYHARRGNLSKCHEQVLTVSQLSQTLRLFCLQRH